MTTRRDRPGSKSPAPGRARRPYSPPRIEQIDIVPGEAMLGFCKTAGESGGMGICGSVCSGPGS